MKKNIRKNIKKFVKPIKKYGLVLWLIFFVAIIRDVFYAVDLSDSALLIVIVLWYFITYCYNLKSTATLKIIVGFLIILGITYQFYEHSPSLEKLSTLVYIFFIFAIVQQFFELHKNH